jgi:transcription elongation factor Elf1
MQRLSYRAGIGHSRGQTITVLKGTGKWRIKTMNRIKPQPDKFILPPTSTCPHCGTKLTITSGITVNNTDKRQPQPGDVSLCTQCGEPCQFDDSLKMIKLSDEILKEVMADPMIVKAMRLIKEYKDKPPQQAAYEAQLDKMLDIAQVWLRINFDKQPSIQYNFTSKTCVIASLDEALDKHLISVNDDALIMFKALGWLDDKPSMPTVLMVKIVMDNVFKEKE